MARLRDNPACADSEFQAIADSKDPGLSYNLTFDPSANIMPKLGSLLNTFSITNKPRVAILREQGVNGAAEMAYAFSTAGFICVDVHMTDIIGGKTSLEPFVGLAAVGGFSYGDVLVSCEAITLPIGSNSIRGLDEAGLNQSSYIPKLAKSSRASSKD